MAPTTVVRSASVGLPYVERRWATPLQATVLSALALFTVVALLHAVLSAPDSLPAALYVAAMLVMALLIWTSPFTVGFGHIRVDEHGLSLWWGRLRRLPSEQIGPARIVAEAEAGTAASRGVYDGIPIKAGRSSYPIYGGDGPAVFVEQRRPGRKPIGWLLASRDPAAVVSALEAVRGR